MFFKKIRNWWLRNKWLAKLTDPDINPSLGRDIGVNVIRIRLPSGKEITVVKPAGRED